MDQGGHVGSYLSAALDIARAQGRPFLVYLIEMALIESREQRGSEKTKQ